MIDPNQDRLKEILLQLAELQARPDSAEGDWEQTFEQLMRARFEAGEVQVTQAVQATVFERVHKAAHELRSRQAERHPNGRVSDKLRAGLSALLHPKQSSFGKRAWAGLAVGIAVIGFAWYALDLPGAPGFKNWMAGGPRLEKQVPQPIPELPRLPTPAPEKPQQPPELQGVAPLPKKATPKAAPPLAPPLRRRSDEGLLARKIEVGSFTTVMGKPQLYQPGGYDPIIAKPGSVFYLGSRIVTGDTDKSEIVFNDGSTIAMNFNTILEIPDTALASDNPKSKIQIPKLSVARPPEVRLVKGQVWTKVVQGPQPHRFAVVTPVATAEALGTEFGLKLRTATQRKTKAEIQKPKSPIAHRASPSQLVAVLTVKEGRVALYNDFGRVVAGDMTESEATSRSAPTEPKRLASLKTFRLRAITASTITTSQLGSLDAAARFVYPLGRSGINSVTLQDREVRIVRVRLDSPAEKAGLHVGDVIVAVNGEPVLSADEVRRAIYERPGARIELSVLREGKRSIFVFTTSREYPYPPTIPGSIVSRLYEATWAAIEGKVDHSLRTLESILAKHPHAAVYNNLGVIWETRDDMGKAVRHYQLAAQLDPRVSLYRYNLGLALRKIGNFERSIEELEKSATLAPRWSEAKIELAESYMLDERFGEALATDQEALLRDPRSSGIWLAKGRVLLHMRRTEDAREAVLKALDLEPDNPWAWASLGMIHRDLGGLQEAVTALRKAISINPKLGHAYSNLGAALTDTKDLDGAERVLRHAIQLDPLDLGDSAIAHNNLGNVLLHLGRLKEAEAIYRKAIELNRNYVLAYNNLGNALADLGRLDEADAMYRKAIELEPAYFEAHYNLGKLLLDRGRRNEAESMYRKAIALDPKDVQTHNVLGVLLFDERRLSEAEVIFRRVVALDPKYAVGYFNLGMVCRDLRRLSEAEAMYRRAIELDPKEANAHYTLGILLDGLGRPNEAEAMYRKAIELDPKRSEAHNNLGTLLSHQGRLDEAEAMFRKAIELNPKNAAAHNNLGWLLESQRRAEEAEIVWRRLAELQPERPDRKNALAWNLAERGVKLDEALELALSAVQSAPNDPNMLDTLGWVHYKRSELTQAEESLKKAIRLFADSSGAVDSWLHLGAVYEKKGDLEAAKDAYRQVLNLKPGHKEAAEALKRLGA